MLAAQLPDREAFIFRICAGRAAHRLADFVKLADQLPAASREKLTEVAQARACAHVLHASHPAYALCRNQAPTPQCFGMSCWKICAAMAGAQSQWPRHKMSLRAPDRLRPGRFRLRSQARPFGWQLGLVRRAGAAPSSALAHTHDDQPGDDDGRARRAVVCGVRWVTRPLSRLAEAAEALGRDINRPPLPETGPREVRRAARAFNSMQERLARYIRTRTGILTAMSHDLKTPITRLRLRAEMLEQPEVREKFVRDLGEMEQMVTATLGFMRGLDDREPLRAIDVGALTAALQADAEELGRDVQVVGEPPGPFSRQARRIEALSAKPARQRLALRTRCRDRDRRRQSDSHTICPRPRSRHTRSRARASVRALLSNGSIAQSGHRRQRARPVHCTQPRAVHGRRCRVA